MLFRIVLRMVLATTSAAASTQLPWPTTGYDKLPTLWFGANESGANDAATLQLIARHSLAVMSWGQDIKPMASRDEEKAEAAASAAARKYLNSIDNNTTILGVYRQIQIALGLFNISHDASVDLRNRNFWLHQVGNASNICGMTPSMGDKPSQWGTWDPYWNFTDPGARDFWLNNFTQQICDEHTGAGYTALYLDEVDDNWCGYWGGATHGGCFFDNSTQIEQIRASYSLYRQMVQKLNDCGVFPIMATFSTMKASIEGGIDPTNPCVVWEDELVHALDGLQWARFYEQWPDEFHMRSAWEPGAKEGDRFAQIIANGILEAKAGIPVVAHVTPHNNSCENSTNQGSNDQIWIPTGFDAFQMAAFYIAQGPNWVWSASAGWTDGAYCWRREYDLQCGHPLAEAKRTGPWSWTRNFTGCDVYVNTNCVECNASHDLYGEIRLKS